MRQIRYAAARGLDLNNMPQRLCDMTALRERRLVHQRECFGDRRLIFTISTGRSGTATADGRI